MSGSTEKEIPPYAVVVDEHLRSGQSVQTSSDLQTSFANTLQLLHRVLRQRTPTLDADGLTKDAKFSELSPQLSVDREILARYQIRKQLGQGGFGTVYLARDTILEREVAVKIPHLQVNQSEELRTRFLRESRAVARLNHPSIVRVLDSGITPTGPYQVSEYVRGERLRDYIVRHAIIPQTTAANYVRQLADAVQHAHERNVLHRDIKPDNILLDVIDVTRSDSQSNPSSGKEEVIPRLTDFGLARLIDEDTTYSRLGMLVGTPKYMSPEQLRGDISAHGTSIDIYSLGVILYELLTGVVPFPDAQTLHARVTVVENPVESPLLVRPGLSRDLATICLKCLEIQPEHRYLSAGDLRDDLARYLDGRPTIARPHSSVEQLYGWAKRHRLTASVVSLLFVLTFCISGLMWRNAVASNEQNKKLLASLVEVKQQRAVAAEMKVVADQARADAVLDRELFRNLSWKSGIREAYATWEQGRSSETAILLRQLRERYPSAPTRLEWSLLQQEVNAHVQILYQADGSLNSVCLVPNSSLVVLGGDSSVVQIVDSTSAQVVRSIDTKIPQVHALSLSHDGTLLAVGGTSSDGGQSFPKIFDFETGELKQILAGQPSTVESLRFDRTASRLIIGCRYQPQLIVDLVGGGTHSVASNRRNRWVDITSDGEFLVAQDTVRTIAVTSLASPEKTRTILVDDRFQFAVMIPETRILAVAVDNRPVIRLIDLDDGHEVGILNCPSNDFSSLAAHPLGRQIYAGFDNGEIACFEIPNSLRGSESEDNFNVLLGESQTRLEIQPIVQRFVAGDRVTDLQSDGHSIVYVARNGFAAKIIGPEFAKATKIPRPWVSASLKADQRSILLGTPDNNLIELSTVPLANEFAVGPSETASAAHSVSTDQGQASSILQSNRRRKDYVPNGHEEVVTEWQTSWLRPAMVVQFSPSQSVYSIIENSRALVLFNKSERLVHQVYPLPGIEHLPYGIHAATFLPDNKRLVFAGSSGLHIAEIQDPKNQKVALLPGYGTAIAVSPDQKEIAVAGHFEGIRVFDSNDLQLKYKLHSVTDCTALVFARDGQSLVSGHNDGTIRFGHREDQVNQLVRAHTAPVSSIVLLEENNLGLSIDRNSRIAAWFLKEATLIGQLFSPAVPRRDNTISVPRLLVVDDDGKMCIRTIVEVPDLSIIEYQIDMAPGS